MRDSMMEKNAAAPLKKILAGVGIAGTGVAGAAIGNKVGKKKGTQEIVNKFKDYNSKENQQIAQRAYQMGKQAELEEIASMAMEDELMKIAAKIDPKVAKGLAIAGGALAAGGAGAGAGFAAGKSKAKKETVQKLKDYNVNENRAIASRAYQMGKNAEDIAAAAAQEELAQYGFDINMDKTATLKSYYDSCFEDELQKVAAPSLQGIGSTIKGSFQNLSRAGHGLFNKNVRAGAGKELMRESGIGKKEAVNYMNRVALENLKGSKAALGILGGTGLAGAGLVGAALNKKPAQVG